MDEIARIRGRYPDYTRARLAAFARRLARSIYPEKTPATAIEAAGPTDRIGFAEAAALDYRPVKIGAPLGPLWSTWWMRITVDIPEAWRGARVDLHWDSRSEALLWLDGRSAAGLNIGRSAARLTPAATGGERLVFHVEVACNRAFGASDGDGRAPPGDPYRLAACEIRRFDPAAWDLFHDFETLRRLEADRVPPQTTVAFGAAGKAVVRPALDSTWAGRLLHDLNRVCNVLIPEDPVTWADGRRILADLLAVRNGGVVHELSAVGHAHIDTAWLWPIEETRRKCQRTFATAVGLMDAYPEFRFAASQAWQYAAIEEVDPDLFARIKAKAAGGQWIPVGGSWVEPDCNLPSGESLCRQFLYGQRWFERAFGVRSRIFWNPDVFGYAGQLPQLMREAGMDRFLTQKLSWNRFTVPPHHSFRWRGIDGSEVLTHFPPADTYNGVAGVEELRYHAANYKDADRSAHGLYLFGHGDGGGGPAPEMIEALRRTADLQGVPRTTFRDPDAFFDLLEADRGRLAAIEGELYFEYHRGTYTSQAEVKRLNRLIEGRLQALEYLCVAAGHAGVSAPTREAIEGLWRVLLVNQFHDILPGSSIAEVYERTGAELRALANTVDGHARDLLDALGDPGAAPDDWRPVDTLGFPRAEVVKTPAGDLAWIEAPAFAAGRVTATLETASLREADGGGFILENSHLRAVLTASGSVKSLVHLATGRECLSGTGNRIVLFEDRPIQYEAWDIDPFALETARDAPDAHDAAVTGRGHLRAAVRFERRLGAGSVMSQTVRLDAGSRHLAFDTVLDWRERRVLVKAMFPVACRAPFATYETMFGAVERPTHANTDADLARFEVPGHRWADLSDPAFGVSLLSDARYGFSTFENWMALSLARGPVSPDPTADIGRHTFRYGLFPHGGDWRAAGVVAEGARFNREVVWVRGAPAILGRTLVSATPAGVVVDTIKPAEDGEGWVARLYESAGAAAVVRLDFGVPVRRVWLSNTLEDRLEPIALVDGGCRLEMRGFQVTTLRLL
ncbi:MAG: glycoside hydrolase family 38 C-terminal domain-containing protein [Caulobacteraceae bacterium]